ncbi:MAG: alpha/beta hydrolase, partial [Alphaproteobacteria bacterium]|nr:alpha/beta hydrolase [Alphaproteobacteria bacterium]
MFDGFQQQEFDTGEVTINARVGGDGPPVLLLHGYPQTHAMWHAVAPRLAERYTVVCTDLRGYGDSGKPPGGPQAGDPDHNNYSKRMMARDQVAVMAALGFENFALIGHDRGGRVAHRLCLDHPDQVSRAAVLDIAPTHKMFAAMNREIAMGYWHWTWLAQPFDLPERMIGADPVWYLDGRLGGWGTGLDTDHPDALADYRRCFADPATIHASCEDYRAGATIDLVHDETDMDNKVACPLLV